MLAKKLALLRPEDDTCLRRLADVTKAIPPRRWLVPLARELGVTQHDMEYFLHVKSVHTLWCARADPQASTAASAASAAATIAPQGLPPNGRSPPLTLPQQALANSSGARLRPGKYSPGMQPVLAPAITSTVLRDLRSGNLQMFTQGNMPFLLANCSTYWDGHAMYSLHRKRREALLSTWRQWMDEDMDCIGIAYDPVSKRERDVFNILGTALERASGQQPLQRQQAASATQPQPPPPRQPTTQQQLALGIGPADIGLGFDAGHVYLLARDVHLNAREDAREMSTQEQWLGAVYDVAGGGGGAAATPRRARAGQTLRTAAAPCAPLPLPLPPRLRLQRPPLRLLRGRKYLPRPPTLPRRSSHPMPRRTQLTRPCPLARAAVVAAAAKTLSHRCRGLQSPRTCVSLRSAAKQTCFACSQAKFLWVCLQPDMSQSRACRRCCAAYTRLGFASTS